MATAIRSTRKPATAKAEAAKPAAKTARQSREQDSVTVTMIRGKRDRQTRVIDTDFFPQAGGGVRFEEEADKGRSPMYVTQEDFAAIGSPAKVRVTVKALA